MSFLQSQDISVIIARQTQIVQNLLSDLGKLGSGIGATRTQSELNIEQGTLEALLTQQDIPELIPEITPTTLTNNLRNIAIIGLIVVGAIVILR